LQKSEKEKVSQQGLELPLKPVPIVEPRAASKNCPHSEAMGRNRPHNLLRETDIQRYTNVYIPDPNDAFSCPGHFEFPEEQ
jgi:hypothetical protein